MGKADIESDREEWMMDKWRFESFPGLVDFSY